MSEPKPYQIIVQGYSQEGLSNQAAIIQAGFLTLEEAKVKARELWVEIKKPEVPYLQVFIADIEKGKNIFYSANF